MASYLLRAPSGRVTAALHGIALVILVGEAGYWLAQPCRGSFICEPMVGLVIGAQAIVFAIGVVLWRAAQRPGLLVVFDALAVGVAGPLIVVELLRSLSIGPVGVALAALPLVLLVGLLGVLADLSAHHVERWLVVGALLVLAAVFAASSLLANSVVPLVVALMAAGRAVGRPSASVTDPPVATTAA